jgi:anti-sigma factor RsiW
MSFSDETLMAFADGELDDITSHEVELAMRLDPAIAEKVRLHQALRSNVFGAFARTLDEEVPQRLQAAVRSGKVVHLDSVRQLRTPPPQLQQPVRVVKRGWSWPEWGALAATLVAGVLAGSLGMRSLDDGQQFAAFDANAGTLTAQGRLNTALTQQLAFNGPVDKDVRVGLSFVSRQG